MQRRAAAIYAVFFLVVAAGAYTAIAVAEEPSVQIDSGHSYAPNESVDVGDRTYRVGNISSGASGASTELTYTNDSARLTVTIINNSTVARYANGSYRPLGDGESPPSGGGGSSGNGSSGGSSSGGSANESNASGGGANASGGAGNATGGGANATGSNASNGSSAATPGTSNDSVSVYRAVVANGSDNTTRLGLTEEFNVSALLGEDSAVENTTLQSNGTRYVRYADNNTTVPIDTYLPDAQVQNFTQGDSFQYGSNNTTIETLNEEGATLVWTGTENTTTEVEEGGNVTLGGSETQYVAHFPDNNTLQLTGDYFDYGDDQAAIEDYNQRVLGFWAVIILSLGSAGLLVGLAYLPVRG